MKESETKENLSIQLWQLNGDTQVDRWCVHWGQQIRGDWTYSACEDWGKNLEMHHETPSQLTARYSGICLSSQATWEAKIRKIVVSDQPRGTKEQQQQQNNSWYPIWKVIVEHTVILATAGDVK
jgi:hypothetical protein